MIFDASIAHSIPPLIQYCVDTFSLLRALQPLDMDAKQTSGDLLKSQLVDESTEWPTEILLQFLHFLSLQCDRQAQNTWHKLAYVVCKRDGFVQAAKRMPRPILLRIEFDAETQESIAFKIPFTKATVVCVDIDWGDGCVDELREKGAGYADHTYAAPGEYNVRIFPARDSGICLDHLGFERDVREAEDTVSWWRPLREIISLGRCGLRSLSYLFAVCGALMVDLQHLRLEEIQDISGMFYNAQEFNQPIGGWNVSNVTDMSFIFCNATQFNQPLGSWNVSRVADMSFAFCYASNFNQPMADWDLSNVTAMSCMFAHATAFNQPIGAWNVSNVTGMNSMFLNASTFNQPVGAWNVCNVTNMGYMFCKASSFNQPIGNWITSSVVDMHEMFNGATAFNQPIGAWNVSNVADMSLMFHNASAFNQPIGAWDVSKVANMHKMFGGASAFNQPNLGWNLSPCVVRPFLSAARDSTRSSLTGNSVQMSA
jgi:surface protein